MKLSPTGAAERIRGWTRRLSTPWGIALVVVTAVGVGLAGYYAYETYDYVEHDNDFCLSCHLMEDPYERFARSAHRDLSCKACHQPTFQARSRMALTQIVQQPDTLVTHAEVPNERCVGCHVEGDRQRWRQISSSAGHRIHLESDDRSLEGLKCVECHSTSLHEFAAASATCQQSGCHEDTDIRLGSMGRLTIHCVACHDFSAPVTRGGEPAGRDSLLSAALRPDREECLSCHAMREQLPDLPSEEVDPHRAACGACHQPHEQATPAEAVERCVDCHARPDTLTSFHRGLREGVLEGCTGCHGAHDFQVEGDRCAACHRVMDRGADAPREARISVGELRPARGSGPFAGGGPALPGTVEDPPDRSARFAGRSAADTTPFRHARHEGIDCTACHATDRTHGRVKLAGPADCRSCHHAAEAGMDCAACHREEERAGSVHRVPTTLSFSTGDSSVRELPFDHADHADRACGDCHSDGLARSARDVSCDGCHAEHHESDARCGACHRKPTSGAHESEVVHVTCGGAGCHEPAPVSASTRSRQQCLACHETMVDHRPGRDCVACHLLPPAREESG